MQIGSPSPQLLAKRNTRSVVIDDHQSPTKRVRVTSSTITKPGKIDNVKAVLPGK